MPAPLRAFFGSFLFLFGFFSLAQAQNPTPTPAPVQMQVSSPFALTVKPLLVSARSGRWFPVAVTLSNTGDPVEGDLRLTLTTGGFGGTFQMAPNDFYARVDLPSNSRKVVWLYGRMERPEVNNFVVKFTGRGFPNLEAQGQTRAPDDNQKVICIVSDTDDGLDDTLRSLRTQATSRPAPGFPGNPNLGGNLVNPGASPVRPLQFGREMVPDRWIGFDAADALVLGDFPHISLAPTQIAALRGFVVGGGTLIAMGGSQAARLAGSPLKDLWPLAPTTSVSASSGEVSGLVERYVPNPQNGGDRLGGAPVVVTRGNLTPDAVLQGGTANAPLFSLRDNGAGRTLFLSFDPSQPPFKGWSGQGLLWREVFNKIVKTRPLDAISPEQMSGMGANFGGGNFGNGEYTPTSATDILVSALGKAPQLKMPAVSDIAWFLALYVFFLVPLNYAILRFFDKRELAWVTIPVIVAVFSVLAYRAALSIRGRAILTRQLDIVQTSVGSDSGRVDSLLWLFSPKSTNYTIVSKGKTGIVSDYVDKRSDQGAFSVLQPGDGSGFTAEEATIGMWTDRAFVAQSLGAMGKGLNLQGRTLKNSLGFDLRGAVWVQDGRVAKLGDLKDGKSVVLSSLQGKRVGAQIPGEVALASGLDKIFDASTITGGIPQSALSAALGTRFGVLNSPPVIIAWGTQSASVLDIGISGAQSRDVTLWVFRVPKLPTQIASTQALVSRVSFEPFNPAINDPNGGGFAYYDCQLPISNRLQLEARGTGVRPGFQGPNYGAPNRPNAAARAKTPILVHFEVLKAGLQNWTPIAGKLTHDDSPEGIWKFESPVEQNWAQLPDRTLRLRVRLDNAQAKVSSLSVSAQ